MAKLKVFIGNMDIQSDDPKVVGNLFRDLFNSLLNIEVDRPEPEPKKIKPARSDRG